MAQALMTVVPRIFHKDALLHDLHLGGLLKIGRKLQAVLSMGLIIRLKNGRREQQQQVQKRMQQRMMVL